MNFKTILAPAVALTMALVNPLQAKAEVTPADQVTAAFSIGICLVEHGRTQDTAQTIFEAGVSKLPEQQVINTAVKTLQHHFHQKIAQLSPQQQKTFFEMIRQGLVRDRFVGPTKPS